MTTENQLNFDVFFAQLDSKLDHLWSEIIKSSPLAKSVLSGEATKELYAIYMIETYHYTSHNARNQALVGTRQDIESLPYLKFCLEHAADEIGHERMALHDVRSIGLLNIQDKPPRPLFATETLISYLYWISLTGNPLQRLGYSYWAESCYHYIDPLIQGIRQTLNLQPAQLTFFIAHSDIDADHFEHVKAIIRRSCKTESDLEAIEYALETTLKLTGQMLDAVYDEYQKLLSGTSNRYSFLLQAVS
ncbi:iron-containing redox enzyme family protein (plasmid) [Deefgea piscis]|uniref:Iron-containing redox enzyme family protein n=1 Tax=Deefgea piscis TaxID=2739061 RepID=A0A6M8SSW4_9NEIS|nr:iron-containing redox enzyme family protein [Deefgea piscis]QKJ68275.1 iron-containing redox enzyme family protein [Deefgea piscis]